MTGLIWVSRRVLRSGNERIRTESMVIILDASRVDMMVKKAVELEAQPQSRSGLLISLFLGCFVDIPRLTRQINLNELCKVSVRPQRRIGMVL